MERQRFPFTLVSDQPVSSESGDSFTLFRQAEMRMALQKDGELTHLSLDFLRSVGIAPPETMQSKRRLIHVLDTPSVGFVMTKNKAIGGLLAEGRVDAAIIGQDRLIESGLEEVVDVLHVFEAYKWPIVLAVPKELALNGSDFEIGKLATQYPEIARRGLRRLGVGYNEIVVTQGGTEAYPYLTEGCQGIVDMRVSGKSLEENGLMYYDPPIEIISPVLVARRERTETVRRIIGL